MKRKSKVQEKLIKGAKSFFGGKRSTATADFMRDRNAATLATRPEEVTITASDREAARKKLESYGPAKDFNPKPVHPEKTEAPKYTEIPLLAKKSFRVLVESIAELSQDISDLEKIKAKRRGEIQTGIELAGVRSVQVKKWLITRSDGKAPSSKIDRKRMMRQLLKRGVNAAVAAEMIDAATVKGAPGRPYINITDTTKPRGRGRGHGEEE